MPMHASRPPHLHALPREPASLAVADLHLEENAARLLARLAADGFCILRLPALSAAGLRRAAGALGDWLRDTPRKVKARLVLGGGAGAGAGAGAGSARGWVELPAKQLLELDERGLGASADMEQLQATFSKVQGAATGLRRAWGLRSSTDHRGVAAVFSPLRKSVHGHPISILPPQFLRNVLKAWALLDGGCRASLGALAGPLRARADALWSLADPVPLPDGAGGSSILHASRYNAAAAAAAAAGGPVVGGAGAAPTGVEAHVDRGLLTLVAQASPGLEVRAPGGAWRRVHAADDEAVLMAGWALEWASAGALKAAEHRVVRGGEEGAGG